MNNVGGGGIEEGDGEVEGIVEFYGGREKMICL